MAEPASKIEAAVVNKNSLFEHISEDWHSTLFALATVALMLGVCLTKGCFSRQSCCLSTSDIRVVCEALGWLLLPPGLP
jgi:hypothetical protein